MLQGKRAMPAWQLPQADPLDAPREAAALVALGVASRAAAGMAGWAAQVEGARTATTADVREVTLADEAAVLCVAAAAPAVALERAAARAGVAALAGRVWTASPPLR